MYKEQAERLFNTKFRVRYNFDGPDSCSSNSDQEKKRAIGHGADLNSFTWRRFISLEDSYNPSPGELNPWSIKKWYLWGCRKFHLHCPFGKVATGNKQGLVYEVDQFLNAKNGFSIDGEVQNTPMPWLTNDFVAVFKALTTGKQGTLDDDTWNSWTIGNDAWFNPSEPIDVIVYIGGMAGFSDPTFDNYLKRWNALFNKSYSGGLARLKNSVIPLIEANCRIAFDASAISPGPIPGKNVSLNMQSANLQRGWWAFWTWLTRKIGKTRMYIESYPFKKNGESNPYLGYGIISDDDWSYSKWVQPGPDGPHMTSELGQVEFWRAIWQNSVDSTPLLYLYSNGVDVPQRYSFLKNVRYVSRNKDGDVRLSPAECCDSNHNYYYNDIYAEIIAYHLLEKQNTRGETWEQGNNTISGILVPNTLLQILPEAIPNDSSAVRQFGSRFNSSSAFIDYIALCLERRRDAVEAVYEPNT